GVLDPAGRRVGRGITNAIDAGAARATGMARDLRTPGCTNGNLASGTVAGVRGGRDARGGGMAAPGCAGASGGARGTACRARGSAASPRAGPHPEARLPD